MIALLSLIDTVLGIYMWILIISAVMSWLFAFNVVNSSNRLVYMIADFLYRATEPVLRPIRRFVPNLGGIDISPLLVILAIIFLRNLIRLDIAPALV
jgi:YggT family protein